IRARPRELDVLAARVGLVESKNLVQYQKARPRVEKGVMKRPQRPILALAGTYERKAHEGRLIEIETPGTVITHKRLEALPAVFFREIAPIQPFDGDLDSVEHLLHGFRDAFPAIAGAQDRMSLDNTLPRAKEGSFLQRRAQRRPPLLGVDPAIHSADGVEQHPRLRRREF